MNPPAPIDQPAPKSDDWVFSSDVNPSTADDEYPTDTCGAAPNPVGATGTGYAQSKLPACNPTDHDADAGNGVTAYEPHVDENPADNPYDVVPEPLPDCCTLGDPSTPSGTPPSPDGTDSAGIESTGTTVDVVDVAGTVVVVVVVVAGAVVVVVVVKDSSTTVVSGTTSTGATTTSTSSRGGTTISALNTMGLPPIWLTS